MRKRRRRRVRQDGAAAGARLTLAGLGVIAVLEASFAAGLLIGRVSTPPVYQHPPGPHIGGLVCVASWYNLPGRDTATGEGFERTAFAGASKTLPLGSRVVVTELAGKRSVVVRINDRGPYVHGRCIDLTPAAFSIIAPLDSGLVPVRIEVLPKDRFFPDVEVAGDVPDRR